MGVDDIGLLLPGSRHGGPVLLLEIVAHHHDAGDFPEEVHPALGYPAVGEIRRQLHGEPDDVDAVEAFAGGQGRVAGRHDSDRMAPPGQVTVDVVNVRGLGVGRVLGVPVGGADDTQCGS